MIREGWAAVELVPIGIGGGVLQVPLLYLQRVPPGGLCLLTAKQ